jgi:hypothetical protein
VTLRADLERHETAKRYEAAGIEAAQGYRTRAQAEAAAWRDAEAALLLLRIGPCQSLGCPAPPQAADGVVVVPQSDRRSGRQAGRGHPAQAVAPLPRQSVDAFWPNIRGMTRRCAGCGRSKRRRGDQLGLPAGGWAPDGGAAGPAGGRGFRHVALIHTPALPGEAHVPTPPPRRKETDGEQMTRAAAEKKSRPDGTDTMLVQRSPYGASVDARGWPGRGCILAALSRTRHTSG